MFSPLRCSLRPHPAHVRSISIPRRGHNLTERYRTLEKTTRANPKPDTHIISLQLDSANATRLRPAVAPIPARVPDTIAGFVIPKEPRAPSDDECCMSGCAVCVYDLYEESLAAYKESVETLRSTLSELHIPESAWPAHIRAGSIARSSPTSTATDKSKDAVLDAFEQMERSLHEKRDRRTVVEAEKRARGDVLENDGEHVGLSMRSLYEGIKWIISPKY